MASYYNDKLKLFKFERILQEDPEHKKIVILGRIPSSDQLASNDTSPSASLNDSAVLILEKTHFVAEELPSFSSDRVVGIKGEDGNDIYHWFFAFLKHQDEFPDVRIQLIYPATELDISKLISSPIHLVAETPEIYELVTKPYIDSIPLKRVQWVYNILDRKAEVETFVAEDPDPEMGFVLLPDMKWDKSNPAHFYLQLLINRHGLRSIRDLRGEHLSLLKYLRSRIISVISEKFSWCNSDQIRMFFHYQPSYYHLHIHITPFSLDIPGITVGKAHLVDAVIANLEYDPLYYKNATIHYLVKESTLLWEKMEKML